MYDFWKMIGVMMMTAMQIMGKLMIVKMLRMTELIRTPRSSKKVGGFEMMIDLWTMISGW